MSKQYLQLVKGMQMRKFDGLIAQTTLAFMRYIFLSYWQRCDTDDRTLGELFYQACNEIQDITLVDALQRILAMVANVLRQIDNSANHFIQQLIDTIFQLVLKKLNLYHLNRSNTIAI